MFCFFFFVESCYFILILGIKVCMYFSFTLFNFLTNGIRDWFEILFLKRIEMEVTFMVKKNSIIQIGFI